MTPSRLSKQFTHSTGQQTQHGQAMVEYAILMILLVTLIAGGIELSVTAYQSSKTNEGAKAGANEWAQAISYSIASNSSSLENRSLLELYRQNLGIDTNATLANRDMNGTLIVAQSCDVLPGTTCPAENVASGVRPKLDVNCTSINPYLNADINLPIDITACDASKSGHTAALISIINDASINPLSATPPEREYEPTFPSHPQQDFDEICTSEEGEGIESIISCRTLVDNYSYRGDTDGDFVVDTLTDIYDSPVASGEATATQSTCTAGSPPCPDGVIDARGFAKANGFDDIDPTFKRLLVLKKQDGNGSSMIPPIKVGVVNRIGLGNHSPILFSQATCNSPIVGNLSDYSHGFPDSAIYLFNPLPIDITPCQGVDATRGNRSRVSILVGGYKDPTPNVGGDQSVEGLPALNQSIFSTYSKVCVNFSGGQITVINCKPVSASNPNGFNSADPNHRVWLKPPGKMCGAIGGGETCPTEGDLAGATGFYFFGDGNNGGAFEYTPSTATNPYFRPTFQLVCDGASHQSNLFDADINTDNVNYCQSLVNAGFGSFKMRVNVRYRSIFESFLTFGLQELTNSNLTQYFYDPNKVNLVNNVVIGAAGSEIGPLGRNGRPTVKQFKDFRGCYEVNVSTPDKIGEQIKTSVSSCN